MVKVDRVEYTWQEQRLWHIGSQKYCLRLMKGSATFIRPNIMTLWPSSTMSNMMAIFMKD